MNLKPSDRAAIQAAIVAQYSPGQPTAAETSATDTLAVDAAGLGTWSLDLRTGEFAVSDRFKSVLGFEHGSGEWSQASLFDHVHPEDVEGFTDELESHLDGLWPFDTECRMKTARGDWRAFRVTGKADWADGGVLQIAGTVEDMTAQRELERRLRESEASFRSVFETSPTALVVTDASGTVVQANDAYAAVQSGARVGDRFELPENCRAYLLEQGLYPARELNLPSHSQPSEDVAVEVRGVRLDDGRTLHVVEDIRARRAAKLRERELRKKIVLASRRSRTTRLPDGFLQTLTHVFDTIDAGVDSAQRALTNPTAGGRGSGAISEHLECIREPVEVVGADLKREDALKWESRRVFRRAHMQPLLDEAARLCECRSRTRITIQCDSLCRGRLMVDQRAVIDIWPRSLSLAPSGLWLRKSTGR